MKIFYIVILFLIGNITLLSQNDTTTEIIEQQDDFMIYEEPKPISKGAQLVTGGCIHDTVDLWVEYICSDPSIPLEYEWYMDGEKLDDIEGIVSGEGTSVRKIILDTNNSFNYNAQFNCKIWPEGYPDNFITTLNTRINLIEPPALLKDLASSYSMEEGDHLYLHINSAGEGVEVYWRKDNEEWYKRKDSIIIWQIKKEDAGKYQARISNLCDTIYSTLADVTVSSKTDINNLDSYTELGLFQISPNPISNKSVIKLNLKQSGKAEIAISDVLGNRIALIYEGYLTKGVQKELNLNSNLLNISSGTYFITLRLGSNVETRQISVVK